MLIAVPFDVLRKVWISQPRHYDTVLGSAARAGSGRQCCRQDLLDRRPDGYHDDVTMCAPLTDEQFERARRLALRLAGIELFDRHRELLERRGAQLVAGDAVDAWLARAEAGDADACRRLIELLTTNVTAFFRHPWHFDQAAEHALWTVHRRGPARLWSAAAATGEEPYSLAMSVIDVFRCDDPAVTILATDIDETALAVARDAEYGGKALAALPPAHHAQFVGEPTAGGRRRLAPAVRRLVEFQRLNLTELVWPIDGTFDVVFCRNVLMYLDACHRYAVLERIASLLEPGGLLLLDPAEHLGGAAQLFVSRGNGVYSRRAASGSASVLSGTSRR
jgi:chemotaxis protein methyltransferase CheR